MRDKGSGDLSLRELAREAGVSPAAPSRHFATKRALLDALALDGAGESFAEQIAALTRTYLEFAADNPALLDLMYSVKYDSGASPELAA